MAKNTYKQDEVLEEPFDIRHLLRASSYIKKYAGRMVVAILLSGIGGAFGYVAPMIIQRALDLAIPDKETSVFSGRNACRHLRRQRHFHDDPKPYHGGCQPEYHLRYPKRPV